MNIDCGEPCTTVFLPFEAASAGRARHMMTEELHEAAPATVIDDATLVLSELVTNGLKHGQPYGGNGIEVGWCLHDDRVLICVCDGGTVSTLRPLQLTTRSLSGRGLAIVDYVADAWTLDSSAGTRITAEISFA